MAADRETEALVEALKRALAGPGEQRLFRSGKLDGLFSARSGLNNEAAARALRDGLLEVTRTEARGKTTLEWVRPTPRAVEFLHEHESPVRALHDLRRELQATREGVPAWQAELRQSLTALGDKLAQDAERLVQRIEALARRVDEALERLDLLGPHLPEAIARAVPWGDEALDYLGRRQASGATGPCPLPELFAALLGRHPELAIAAFHDGLRRLHEKRLISLLPSTAVGGEMAQPEYALLDGGQVLYYATR